VNKLGNRSTESQLKCGAQLIAASSDNVRPEVVVDWIQTDASSNQRRLIIVADRTTHAIKTTNHQTSMVTARWHVGLARTRRHQTYTQQTTLPLHDDCIDTIRHIVIRSLSKFIYTTICMYSLLFRDHLHWLRAKEHILFTLCLLVTRQSTARHHVI